jgi:putative ATPase
VVRLRSLDDAEIGELLARALEAPIGLNGKYSLTDEAQQMLCRLSGGDARSALTLLEASAGIASQTDFCITGEGVSKAAQRAVVVYDKDGDQHYDVVSAFIKSMRGSDVDAALHYLARMLEAGEDPRFISRRIVILASEDIGMADSSALQTAIAAHQAVSFIGMPEAALTLAHAVIHCSLAPKSNAVTVAIEKARSDVRNGRGRQVPAPLRDAHYAGATKLGHGVDYIYPHDLPAGVAAFDYLPSDLRGARYFEPTAHGAEARWAAVVDHLRALLRGESVGSPPAPSAAAPAAQPVQPVEKS